MTIIELDQSSETPLTVYQRGPFNLRYAYARSKDCQDSGERGQDYLVCRVEPFRVAFALCDGVGQSFFGGIGSQFVGEALIEWLWKFGLDDDETSTSDQNKLDQQLREHLDSKKVEATQFIHEKDLHSIDSEYIRDALETRREKRGTQSNFVCGIIDIPSQLFPKGRVFLFWLGDAKIQIWQNTENKTVLLNADWNKQEGWSSKFGVSGEIHNFQGNLEELNCIIAYSDGVDPIQHGLSPKLTTEILAKQLNTLGGDDVSFLELSILQISRDLEDDLVSVLRNTPHFPVRIVKQIETIKLPPEKIIQQTESVKRPLKKIIVEIKKIPFLCYPIFVGVVMLTSIFSCIIGLLNSPASLPLLLATNTPYVIILPPGPTSTLMPTGTPTIAPQQPEGVFLNVPLIPIEIGCKNISIYPDIDQTKSYFEVHGPYVMTGYSGENCQGDKVVELSDGKTFFVEITILSIDVEAISYPQP